MKFTSLISLPALALILVLAPGISYAKDDADFSGTNSDTPQVQIPGLMQGVLEPAVSEPAQETPAQTQVAPPVQPEAATPTVPPSESPATPTRSSATPASNAVATPQHTTATPTSDTSSATPSNEAQPQPTPSAVLSQAGTNPAIYAAGQELPAGESALLFIGAIGLVLAGFLLTEQRSLRSISEWVEQLIATPLGEKQAVLP